MPAGSGRGKMVICGREDECERVHGDAEIWVTAVTCYSNVRSLKKKSSFNHADHSFTI